MPFSVEFDRHALWRREHARRLRLLDAWLTEHELADGSIRERLALVESQLNSEKVVVAFVAEFSRGKSELINALFFADHGRRIVPASAGRTTMCPTELGFDPSQPPSLRLLPIETRLETDSSLADWRRRPDRWAQLHLAVDDAGQLAATLDKIAEVRRVTIDDARALGFWHDGLPDDNPPVDGQGMVDVPVWRHALVNLPHPLLRQGLVIVDTPGLNAVGAEPDLTVNLIPQAHAVVFVLGADAGVTRSDMAIWREHLVTDAGGHDARMVVLNKIDMLWDALSTQEKVDQQIEQQRLGAADVLGLPERQVLAVSAQKGLVAKITGHEALLASSRLPEFEAMLSRAVTSERERVLRAAVATTLADVFSAVGQTLQRRRRDLADQRAELTGLRGKNATVIKQMRMRLEHEQAEFSAGIARVQAVRVVHQRLLRELMLRLGRARLNDTVESLRTQLLQAGLKMGTRKVYEKTFGELHESFRQARGLIEEIHGMLAAAFRQLNAEFGFSLQLPVAPLLTSFESDLQTIERNHVHHLSPSNALRLMQAGFAQRLLQALLTRLQAVFEGASGSVELWHKSVQAQLERQLTDRRTAFTRRIDAIGRIQQAAGNLEERIAQIEQQEHSLREFDVRLIQLTAPMLALEPVVEQDLRRAA